ncbi:ArsA family ATPase [Actinokineospora globicatena]|uniref:ArsA family ATPase n=1 Tax=Actinokineospora globicatena TaxID=103729 RepID=UPI0020A3D925|nr:ArsA family ATPase [Actinokineospora globicatena]MCP2302530.1 arsenite-transporting ATPase [Actinokineospora globicatena]GLW75783.1 arsenic-transporting ATPase [Actinokineospora globicatena]GLW82623.1 arsenic-transporting ATPase [Actinokineospora globicatena]
MRVLLFTGKGGVGKTTLAAATAALLAGRGHRTLVVSTDPAHSLADVLAVPLGPTPSRVDTALHAAHIDARALVDQSWPALREHLGRFAAGLGLAALDAEELTVLPGVDELLALTEVARLARTGEWDVVVVDCGPTAETLRLLALPEAIAAYLERSRARVLADVRAAAAVATDLAEHLADLRSLLTDPATTGVRLVFTPERLVVAETRRTLAALALRGIHVDALIANRLVPRARRWQGPAAAWLRARRSEQDAVMSDLDAGGVPLRVVEHRAAEPVGTAALLSLAADLYADTDPLAARPAGTPLLSITPDGPDHLLRLALPLPAAADLDLARVGDDLSITIDGVRRVIALPLLLRHHTVTDAEADAAGLLVRFAAERT